MSANGTVYDGKGMSLTVSGTDFSTADVLCLETISIKMTKSNHRFVCSGTYSGAESIVEGTHGYTLDFTGTYHKTHGGDIASLTGTHNFTIILGEDDAGAAHGPTLTATGYFSGWSIDGSVAGINKFSGSVDISGEVTETPAA